MEDDDNCLISFSLPKIDAVQFQCQNKKEEGLNEQIRLF